MKTPLRVLLCEDDPDDAELIVRELRRAGFDPAWERVDTEADYLARLHPGLDIILSDYAMPRFSGARALDLLQERALDVPFIIISGTIGEETAVAAMRRGAADYLLKDRLVRLSQAVTNALARNAMRRERRQAEQALRDNAAFVENVLNSLSAEVVVVDQAGTITATNEAWKRFARENGGNDGLGENYLAACTRSAQTFHDADAVAAREGLRAVLEGATAHFAMEYPCHSPTELRWFQMRVSPLGGARGGAVIAHENITERQRTEESLRLFRSLVDQSSDAFEVIDPATGRFLDVNEIGCAELGYSRAEYLALRVTDIDPTVPEAEWPRVVEKIRLAGSMRGEGQHRRKNGDVFPVEINSKWVRLDRDYIVAVVRDTTERKRAEERRRDQAEAERANLAKSEFLSRMSHELRTPLNAILGFGQLLELATELEPRHVQSVGHILRAGRHLLGLIDEVLDIARIESGRLDLSPEPVPVRPLITEVLAMIRPLAAHRGVALSDPGFDGQGALDAETHVAADRQRLSQVLLNLLSNAVKYNVVGGTVTLNCVPAPHPGRLRIRVADTGPGIPAEKRARLFTPFDRLDAESSTVEGTGLGLALSKRLMEAMGGDIGMEEEAAPGTSRAGTVFWVELPLAASPLERSADQDAPDEVALLQPPPPLPDRTLLYVEDNLSNLNLVEHLLKRHPGVRLLSAMQGGLGLELARQHHPDLILLDVHLPDLPGWEVLARLRADPVTAAIPIVVISADATPRQMDRMMAAGASTYLTKPIDVRHFLQILRQTLAPDGEPSGPPPPP